MRYIDSETHDPYYNLALEEYVLLNLKDDDYLLLWSSEKSVVVGKYQNIYEELNLKEIRKRKTPALRRISGGGTVYHDRNNLNYSMIMDYSRSRFSSYDVFLDPIIRALNELGVPAGKRRACDIAIGEKKISGSAQTIKKDRILHHGTLLFDSDLTELHELLRPTQGRVSSKAVKSFRSEVTNISAYWQKKVTVAAFQTLLLGELFPAGVQERVLTEKEKGEIRKLAQKKYQSWDWTYGFSPKFTYQNEITVHKTALSVDMEVRNGVIHRCEFGGRSLEKHSGELIGVKYDLEYVEKKLASMKKDLLPDLTVEDLMRLVFGYDF